MAILYNEGRVVGYSSYELYLKNYNKNVGGSNPLSEQQWMSMSLASGESLILKLNASNTSSYVQIDEGPQGYVELELPSGTNLTAASTIYASLFLGKGVYDNGVSYAKAVASYGDLISNTASSSPISSTVPVATSISDYTGQLKNYLKIRDAVIYQPGTWSDATVKDGDGNPAKVVNPDFLATAKVRLLFDAQPDFTNLSDLEILLTGFLPKPGLEGTLPVTLGVIDNSEGPHPENGDFLGPERFPWACKVILTVPTSLKEVVATYEREDEGSYISLKKSDGEEVRLYVCSSEPTVEQGFSGLAIGIGW